MVRKKWQDNIKETLEKRAITPSETSWDVLANRLEVAEKRKSSVLFWRLGIAASVIGMLIATALVFDGGSTDVQQPVLVKTQEQNDGKPIPTEELSQQKQLVQVGQNVESNEPVEKNASETDQLKTQNSLASPIKESLGVAKIERNKSLEPLKIIAHKETLENQKVLEIVAQIKNLKRKGETVSDADIDALLTQAQKELAQQNIIKESIVSVDASALLQDVETDLQKSFRNKIFETLKTSYETVITAVAERNN